MSVRWCPLVVYLQSADPPSSPPLSSPSCRVLQSVCPGCLTQSLLGVGGRTRRGRGTGPGGERSVCVCVVRECASVCVCVCGSRSWKPLHWNATQADFKVTSALNGYAKTWVAVQSPPSPLLLLLLRWLVRSLLRRADSSERILRPGAGLCFGCAAAPPRIQTVGRKRHHEQLNLQRRPVPFD